MNKSIFVKDLEKGMERIATIQILVKENKYTTTTGYAMVRNPSKQRRDGAQIGEMSQQVNRPHRCCSEIL